MVEEPSRRFVSTRGEATPAGFADVLLAGLAPDGGLTMPAAWPRFTSTEIAAFAGRRYQDAAFAILSRFAGGDFTTDELKTDIEAAYAEFDDPAIVPLVEIGPDRYLLELFHGPTLAFKDLAMQVLGRLFARALAKRGGRATVVAATSGDTGSAAIAAFGGLADIDLFVIHPKGRVSDVQRRQMTTSPHANVHNIALEGTFDDAQAIVKALFADKDFARDIRLTAVNSINFARIAAQSVYYFTATAALGTPATFVVPTGNFGDIFAGEAAAHMGLPVAGLVIATNENDILARALAGGVYAPAQVHATLSPSMDIQVASNFERALFEASGRDGAWVQSAMARFTREHVLPLPPRGVDYGRNRKTGPVLENLRARYAAVASNDEETIATIRAVHARTGRVIDPHTAVAVSAADKLAPAGPTVILATAHPAKFSSAVHRAIGEAPTVPARLKALENLPERMETLGLDLPLIRHFISSRLAG